MDFVDTHAHIQSAGQILVGDRGTRELWAKAPEITGDAIIANAHEAGVTKLMCVGCDLEDSRLAIDFAAQHDNCWATIGIHPHEATAALQDAQTLNQFAALVHEPKVMAIGECGLDYFYEHSVREDQIQVLKFQLSLAQEANLPMVFHVRDALDDFWPLLDSFGGKIRGVLHSFTDSQANLDKALARGLYIGVNGIATFAKDPAQIAMYKAIPTVNMVFETDAPFLTPVPFRGKVNEPKQIRTIAEYLAALRNEDLAELAQATTQNARTLFDI